MASLKKRAREKGTGKFVPDPIKTTEISKPKTKRRVGRPRTRVEPEKLTFELSITVSIGGGDIPTSLLENVNAFFVRECLAGKCSVERGGAAYHLHFQMIVRIQAVTMISVSRLLKSYLGWDKDKPAGAVIICKKLSQKGLHTFHGIIGYCMKDSEQDHFQTIDHNISAEDLQLGLEQLALHGREECKMRIMLTQRNFAQKCLQWRRWNYKHPAVPDWEKEFFLMLKTGKYYPCASWVVGTYGRGYEPCRMQSYWRMLVSPTTITPEDARNVFCQPDQINFSSISRKEWFDHRWEKNEKIQPADKEAAVILAAMAQKNQEEKGNQQTDAIGAILVHTPKKLTSTAPKNVSRKGKEKVESSPCRRLWPTEWHMEQFYSTQETASNSSGPDGNLESALAFGEYAPVYKRTKLPICAL